MALTNKQRLNAIRRIRTHLKKAEGFNPEGGHYKAILRDLEVLERDASPAPHPKVPLLGPIVKDGKSVLLQDCTHITDGLGWPAFDDGFRVGLAIVAPEAGYVDDNTSSAQGGNAFYFTGNSGIRYWIGHIAEVPKLNQRFKKGEVMTHISADHPRPHVHLGLDARKLLHGKHLESHTNYTHGAPLIGAQLAKA